jgi:hypothetical protein
LKGSALGCVVKRAPWFGSICGAPVGTMELPPKAVATVGRLLVLGGNDTFGDSRISLVGIPFVARIDAFIGIADDWGKDIFDSCGSRIEFTLEFPDKQDDCSPSLEYNKHDVSRVVSFLQVMAKACPTARFPFPSSSITAPVMFSPI